MMESSAQPAAAGFLAAEDAYFARYGLTPRRATAGPARILEVGSGRPILYVHGGGGCGAIWASLVAEIQRRVGGRHLMPDRPGFGLTPPATLRGIDLRAHAAGFLAAVLDALAIDAVDIVANSMGGLWSLWLARVAPARVRSLTLLGAPAFVGGSSAPLPMRLLAMPGIGRVMMALERPSLTQSRTQWRRLGHDPSTIIDSLHELGIAHHRLPTYGPAWRALLARCLRLGGPVRDVVVGDDELAALTVPISIVWGANDPFAEVALGERLAKACRASFRVVDGGHLPWIDQPVACAAAVPIDGDADAAVSSPPRPVG